ncbi:MAG: hypothetical protein U1A72_20825 [Sulfuritalea sp.]|nr:hypothetical protein [Sulfuritalea sp.]
MKIITGTCPPYVEAQCKNFLGLILALSFRLISKPARKWIRRGPQTEEMQWHLTKHA